MQFVILNLWMVIDPHSFCAIKLTPLHQPEEDCFQFDFLGDVNYPPGTVMKPGTKFSKTWTVKNTGTCKWTVEYDLVLAGGDAMGTNKRGDITSVVYPGDIVDLTIHMKAPLTEGTYYGYWMIVDPLGARFGYGPNNEWSLGIEIEVKK